MKKINNVEELRGVLRKIIISQDENEITNFNSLYDYSEAKNMFFLWGRIKEKIKRKTIVDWKKIKFPTLDMTNVNTREEIFKDCPLHEINLINTHNIINLKRGFQKTENLEKISLNLKSCEDREKIFCYSGVREIELLNTQNVEDFTTRFYDTKNLEKINNLYLDNCNSMEQAFEKSNIKELNFCNSGNVQLWFSCFRETKIEEIELDMIRRDVCDYMFCQSQIKKLNLKNCENIISVEGFIQGCENLNYLEMNLTNIFGVKNFINEKNNIKYLKLSGLEKYGNKDFCDIFFNEGKEKEYYKNNPIPHIETKEGTSFNIISDNNSNIRIKEKIEKEKMREEREKKERKNKLKRMEKIADINSQKEYNLEINL